jgi:SET domain-containing protein
MLIIRTRVDHSAIDGLGLFAAEMVPKGTHVWQFTPGFDLDLEPSSLDGLPAVAREAMLHYGYIDARLQRFILCCDNARFINHSDNPNLAAQLTGDQFGIDVALRDIHAGEEITIDYSILEGTHPVRK